MDLRIKRIETHLSEDYDDQSENTENTNSNHQSESEIPRQSDGFVSNIQQPLYQPRAFNSRHDVMSTMVGTAPKQMSPQQSVSNFPPTRQTFMRIEEENSGDSLRIKDLRQSVEGVRSNAPTRLSVEPMKRKWAPRCDSSLQQTKKSKF